MKNDIYGISGGSGSGKTTLVNVLLGLLKPFEGKILLDGKLVDDNISFKKIVGYVPQSSLILDDSLTKNIVFGSNHKNIDLNWIKRCVRLVELSDFVKSLKNGLDTILGEDGSKISGGQKQRIGLARALYSKPKIIVLDEATNALDKKIESSILETVVNLNKEITFVIISHDNQVLKICNRRYYM
jgi:ATP-binding cassette subfamily C protein